MQYPCPKAADLADVQALNAAFIDLSLQLGDCPQFAVLQAPERERMSAVPYLLFTLQHENVGLWRRIFNGTADLADQARPSSDAWAPLAAATLAFLWSLSRKDPHSARLFSGCSQDWCIGLADRRLICVTNRMLQTGIRPVPRVQFQGDAWEHVLSDGVSANRQLREATMIGLFQHFNLDTANDADFASAACRIPQPFRLSP